MKQVVLIGLLILGLGLVQCNHVNFDCVLTECAQELEECKKADECNKQFNWMNECYNKSSAECFSKSLLSGDRLIEDDCMQDCLNESKIQTLEGSNVISCQFDRCMVVNWDYFGLFKSQQNRAYFVAWFMFFAIISVLALIVKIWAKN